MTCISVVVVTVSMLATASISAQNVVDDVAARHPEITMIELLAARSESDTCRTVAATDPREVGRKCDEDALALMKGDKIAVDKEREGFDVALPLHDASGAVIALAGLTFKATPGQTRAAVVRQAQQIAAELEKRLPSRRRLFEPSK